MNTCVKPCDDYQCGICREEEAEAEESHIDMGDLCVHCENDTSFGSGRFVNRYPVFELERDGDGIEYTGYCCNECETEFLAEHEEQMKEHN